MDELDILMEELQGSVGQPVLQEPVVQQPATEVSFEVEQTPLEDWIQPDTFTEVSEDETWIQPDTFSEPSEETTQEGSPTSYSQAISELSGKETLTEEDIINLPFEDIVRLADISSPLEYSAKAQLSEALRGSTTRGAIGEFLIGSPATRDDPIEGVLEDKYDEFIERNPDMRRNFVQRAANSLMTGSPINALIGEESQTVLPESAAQINSLGNAMFGEFGDELLGSLGAEGMQRAIQASNQQLEDNEIVGDALLTDLIGLAVPSTAAARAIGLGAQGVGLLGNVVRGAGLGAVEGGVSAAGAADGETAVERIDDALTGAALGAATGGLAPVAIQGGVNLVNRFRSGDSQARRVIQNTVRDINKALPKGEPRVSLEELAESLNSGETLPQFMMRKGLDREARRDIINYQFDKSRALMGELQTESQRRIARTAAEMENTRTQLGEQVGAARVAMPSEEVRSVVSEMAKSKAGTRFINSALKPYVKSSLSLDDDIVREAGYRSASDVPVWVDRNTGRVYIVKANKDGNAPRPNKNGEYPKESLEEYYIYGDDLVDVGRLFLRPDAAGLGQGDLNTQVLSRDMLPFSERLRALMNEDPNLREANDAFRQFVDTQTAVSESRASRQSYINYTEKLRASDLPQNEKDTLEFLAKEIDTLNTLGRSTDNLNAVNAVRVAIESALMGTMLGRGVGSTLRYMGMQWLANRIAGRTNLVMTGKERQVLPVMRHFINANDDEISALMDDMIAFGVRDKTSFENWLLQIAPIIGAEAGTQANQNEYQDEFSQLGAQGSTSPRDIPQSDPFEGMMIEELGVR